MNEQLRHPFPPRPKPATTRVADGLDRRAWTVDEVEKMVAAGIIGGEERFELIGGELVAMPSKGIRHEAIKLALNAHWNRIRPDSIMVGPETPLRLGPNDEPEPEFIVYPSSIPFMKVREGVNGSTVLLVVEIADSSLDKDMKVMAPRYAKAGVRELWVINAKTLATSVHRDPTPNAYLERFQVPGRKLVTPLLVPALAVRLRDLF
jgi:hypothetical protein